VIPVQQLRRRIEPVRPHDRPRLLVDAGLAKVLRIPERLTEAAAQLHADSDFDRLATCTPLRVWDPE
jgi:hypothetical protein